MIKLRYEGEQPVTIPSVNVSVVPGQTKYYEVETASVLKRVAGFVEIRPEKKAEIKPEVDDTN